MRKAKGKVHHSLEHCAHNSGLFLFKMDLAWDDDAGGPLLSLMLYALFSSGRKRHTSVYVFMLNKGLPS